jgi:hypothetical protein
MFWIVGRQGGKQHFTRSFLPFAGPLLITLAFLGPTPAKAQESLRLSLASAEAARARREAASAIGYYNLKLGPTAWKFGASVGLEANDNIRLVSVNPQGDLIFHTGIQAHMLWPVSDVNSLNLSVGAGYSAYVEYPEFSRFYVTPNSELSFDLYIGDFWINLHDRFSITQNNYQDPTVVGSADYALLENAVGETTTWDLNTAVVRLGYDHVNYVTIHKSGPISQPDGQSEVFSLSSGYRVRPGILTGLELGGTLFAYDEATATQPYTDATGWNIGWFLEAQLSQYIHGRVSAGYTVYTPESIIPGTVSDFQGVYSELDLNHRVNQYVDYTLSGGRTVNFAYFGGTVDLYFARWQANWKVLRKIEIGTSFQYDHGTQLSLGGETFDRYGPGLSVGRTITHKLYASLSYQFYWRGSDTPNRDYTDNVLLLNGTYQF